MLQILEALVVENNEVKIIDQTKLPQRLTYKKLNNIDDFWHAIKRLEIRGAPAIGIAAAYGIAVSSRNHSALEPAAFRESLLKDIEYLKTSRPTAVNLFWALQQQRTIVESHQGSNIDLSNKLMQQAAGIHEDDKYRCRKIGEHGQAVVPQEALIHTHCNTGALATGGIGTALGVVYKAAESGKKVRVFMDETRPLLQGSRLTAFELNYAGINATLIADNMAGLVMRKFKPDLVIVGADRIASNGDTANKIGTYGLAVLAKHHNIPFYVAAPLSTFDMTLIDGSEIPIEERTEKELKYYRNEQTAPAGIEVYNPAFDVTPAEFITGIITEKGIISNPDSSKIKKMVF